MFPDLSLPQSMMDALTAAPAKTLSNVLILAQTRCLVKSRIDCFTLLYKYFPAIGLGLVLLLLSSPCAPCSCSHKVWAVWSISRKSRPTGTWRCSKCLRWSRVLTVPFGSMTARASTTGWPWRIPPVMAEHPAIGRGALWPMYDGDVWEREHLQGEWRSVDPRRPEVRHLWPNGSHLESFAEEAAGALLQKASRQASALVLLQCGVFLTAKMLGTFSDVLCGHDSWWHQQNHFTEWHVEMFFSTWPLKHSERFIYVLRKCHTMSNPWNLALLLANTQSGSVTAATPAWGHVPPILGRMCFSLIHARHASSFRQRHHRRLCERDSLLICLAAMPLVVCLVFCWKVQSSIRCRWRRRWLKRFAVQWLRPWEMMTMMRPQAAKVLRPQRLQRQDFAPFGLSLLAWSCTESCSTCIPFLRPGSSTSHLALAKPSWFAFFMTHTAHHLWAAWSTARQGRRIDDMCLILFDAVRACSVGVLHITGTSNLGFGGPGPDLVSPYYRD